LTETDAEHGEIRIITPGSIGLLIYPMLLEWQKQHLGLSIRHRFAPDAEVLDAVLKNQYELGIVAFKPDDPRVMATPFAEETLELVAPAGHKLCSWDDLMQMGFIDHPDGQAMATRLFSRRFPGNAGFDRCQRRVVAIRSACCLSRLLAGWALQCCLVMRDRRLPDKMRSR
jgi:DNA-binding transcriptional LysR family regulator